jgi:hypothetical protein
MIRIIRKLWNRLALSPRYLGATSVLLLFGMLAACLWPFHAPKNTALPMTGGGIAFNRHGVLLSSDSLTVPGNRESVSCSIELWLAPDLTHSFGTILAIYSPENPRQFTVSQWRTGLALRSASAGDPTRIDAAPSYTPDVFTPGEPVFVTITSGERGTQVYRDGSLLKLTSSFFIANRVLAGKLVAGTGASSDNSWPGQLRGLAIYTRTLDPAEVKAHFKAWATNGRPDISDSNALLALYVFQEETGRSFRNQVAGGPGLYLPEQYFIPAKSVFSRPSLENGEDIVANIIGFMPLGFTLCGYLVTSHRTRRALIATIALCGALSLIIESLQVFLPTRDSDTTDVITNLIGAAIGALVYQWCATIWSVTTPPASSQSRARSASAGAPN